MPKVSLTIEKPKGCSSCPLFHEGIWEHCVPIANGITGMTLPQGETFTHLAQTFHNFDETTAPKEIIDKIADGTYTSPFWPLVENDIKEQVMKKEVHILHKKDGSDGSCFVSFEPDSIIEKALETNKFCLSYSVADKNGKCPKSGFKLIHGIKEQVFKEDNIVAMPLVDMLGIQPLSDYIIDSCYLFDDCDEFYEEWEFLLEEYQKAKEENKLMWFRNDLANYRENSYCFTGAPQEVKDNA